MNNAQAINDAIILARIVNKTTLHKAARVNKSATATAGLNAARQILHTAPIPTITEVPIENPK